jgi:hypothetical protein
MENEFVPYNLAIQLKELGFDEPCLATIDQTEYIHIKGTKYPIRGAMCYMDTPCPTYSQVFRWFREKYDLFCWIEKFHKDETYIFQIPPANFTKIQGHFKTYEEAELECLKKLIEIVKDGK